MAPTAGIGLALDETTHAIDGRRGHDEAAELRVAAGDDDGAVGRGEARIAADVDGGLAHGAAAHVPACGDIDGEGLLVGILKAGERRGGAGRRRRAGALGVLGRAGACEREAAQDGHQLGALLIVLRGGCGDHIECAHSALCKAEHRGAARPGAAAKLHGRESAGLADAAGLDGGDGRLGQKRAQRDGAIASQVFGGGDIGRRGEGRNHDEGG